MAFDLCSNRRDGCKLFRADFVQQAPETPHRPGADLRILFGFLFTAILVASNGPPLASAGELTGLWLTSATTYIALAFGFWAFLNLNMTSLRSGCFARCCMQSEI